MFKHLSTENPNPLLLPFATAEFPVQSKETTSNDKSHTCGASTPTPKSSETSEVGSTSNGKGFGFYWTDYLKEISSHLLLPIGIDSPDLASNSFDIWLNPTVENSWFLTKLFTAPQKNLPPIYCQSYTSFPAECTDSDDIVTKSKKIRVYPTQEQKATLNKWFGVSRFVYNQTVEYLRQPGTKASWLCIKTGTIHSLPDWASDVPYQIKSIAIRDACQAVSNAKKKFKETGEFHSVKFRSKKQPYQSIFIPKSALSECGVYQTLLGKLKMAETLPESPKDSRLIQENDDYFLCVPHESPIVLRDRQRESSCRVVSCDPGVRTFLTLFSEDCFGWLGHQSIGKIQRLCHHLDDLLSQAEKARRPKRRNLRRAANRLRRRIRNLVDELHQKVAKFLVENFDLILLPTFETSDMTKRAKRKLRKKSVRQMLTLSHYRFKKFLHHKAKEYGKIVLDFCEAYTSKTVSWTGEVIAKLGGRKVIKASDGTTMDRDKNGARGIFLRALGDSPMLQNLMVS